MTAPQDPSQGDSGRPGPPGPARDPRSQTPPAYGPPPGYGTPPAGGPPAYGAPTYGAPTYGAPAYGDPPGYGQPGPYAGGPASTDSKAVIALVLAIASFLVFPLVPAIVAVVLAGQSDRAIAQSGGRLTGTGLNLGARITAWINIALCVAVIALIAIAFAALDSNDFS